jgi:chromosome partitioning protein
LSRNREGEKFMRAITLASQKGGTGKSTLCIGLAVAAIEDGERVSLLETDRQGTISNWAARRANPEPVVERVADRVQLERALRVFERRGCTLAIIDTAGSDNDFASDAIRAANLCLIPARPSLADIEATHPTLKAIRRLDKEFAFVLNQTPPRGQRPTRVALALNEVGVLALPYIVLRNDHMDSLAAGLAVSEFAPDSIAAAEIRALWAWSKQRLAMKSAAKEQAPEHDEAPITQTRPDDAVGIVNNDPLYNSEQRPLVQCDAPVVSTGRLTMGSVVATSPHQRGRSAPHRVNDIQTWSGCRS